MSVRAAPGSVPRNGLPEMTFYTYRGTGRDTLTPNRPGRKRKAETPVNVSVDADGRCLECTYVRDSPSCKIACGSGS